MCQCSDTGEAGTRGLSIWTSALEVMSNLRTFPQLLATDIKILLCRILYFEMYINSLNMECKAKLETTFLICLFKRRKMNKQNRTVIKIHESL